MQYTLTTTPLVRVTVERNAVYVSEGTWPSILTVCYRSTDDRNFMSAGNCGYIEMVSPERLEEIKIQFAQKSA